jgi:bifunctional non-homologous end joining protein LigD
VIGGYTQPDGERKHFGALLVGVYQDGKLKFAGRVGTGFSEELLKLLSVELNKIAARDAHLIIFQQPVAAWIRVNHRPR